MSALQILPLEAPVEVRYAEIRAGLETADCPIGPNDLIIAAHALASARLACGRLAELTIAGGTRSRAASSPRAQDRSGLRDVRFLAGVRNA